MDDVFNALGLGEWAAVLRARGFGHAQVARELGLSHESLTQRLVEVAKQRAADTLHSGALTSPEANELLAQFQRHAQHWADSVFADGDGMDVATPERTAAGEMGRDTSDGDGRLTEAASAQDEGRDGGT